MKLGVEKGFFFFAVEQLQLAGRTGTGLWWALGGDGGDGGSGGWAGLCKQEMHNEHAAAGGPATPSAAH